MNYVPLRAHSHHSLLTGVGGPADWVARGVQLGLPALALCEVDTIGGLVEFLQAARGTGVRPIVGAEISDPDGGPGRVVALVQTEEGYQNLCKLVTARRLGHDPGSEPSNEPGHEPGGVPGPEPSIEPNKPPRGDGAASTPEPNAVRESDFDLVHSVVRWQKGLLFLVDHPRLLLALYGRVPARQVFAALSPAALPRRSQAPAPPPTGSASYKTADPGIPAAGSELIEAARATGAALLAVPDAYYPNARDRDVHRLHVAVKYNALLADLPPAWLAPEPAHLPSANELARSMQDVKDVPGAWPLPGEPAPLLARTCAVAETCRYQPPLGGVLFPRIELDGNETPYSKLCQLAFDGARRRYRPMGPEVLQRLQFELSTIQNLGFSAYFLLVNGIAEFARQESIPHVGRGSAADSLVAYCLRLTDADPLRYSLPFERFLNPARKDRPDIDLDFCWRRRDEVLQHVFDLFGTHRTAMISTLNRFGARSAFREAALAHGIPPAEFRRWSRRIPMHAGVHGGMQAPAPFDGTGGSDELDPEQGFDRGGLEVEDQTDEAETAAASPPAPETSTPPAEKKQQEQSHPKDSPSLTHPGGGGGGWAQTEKQAAPGPGGPPAGAAGAAEAPAAAAPNTPTIPSNPLASALRQLPEMRHFPFHDPRFAAALRDAGRLLETPRHFGLHPGGVVVAPDAITDCLACAPSAKGPVVTHFDKNGVEALGLVKMDLLGNRALTTLEDACALLKGRDIHIEWDTVPEDDPKTAALLRHGKTLGCFQVESPGMRHLLQQTGASSMDDVIQAVALIRPGPAQAGMKEAYVRRFRKKEEPLPPHPMLEPVLRDTYGVMLYQEDVMHVAAKVAGMDLATADRLRRALQKKRTEELPALRAEFMQGCQERGLTSSEAQDIWMRIEGFASFAFCKAHAVTYGRIAYRAAWLKAHHPIEFLAAFLNSETGYYATRVYIEEARRLGAIILGPDINRSLHGVSLEPRADGRIGLRLGLNQVFGLSENTRTRILDGRQRQPFLSLPDVLERSGAHSDEMRFLIRCGAFDAFDRTRPELLWRLHLLRKKPERPPKEARLDMQELNACQPDLDPVFQSPSAGWNGHGLGLNATRLPPGGQASLFAPPPGRAPALPGLPDWNPQKRGTEEHELLGVSLHLHPTQLFACPGEERLHAAMGTRRDLRTLLPPRACADLPELIGARITLRAWLAASRRVRTQNGEWMRFLTLEDASGLAEAILFPGVFHATNERLRSDETLLVSGIVEDQLGACLLRTENIW